MHLVSKIDDLGVCIKTEVIMNETLNLDSPRYFSQEDALRYVCYVGSGEIVELIKNIGKAMVERFKYLGYIACGACPDENSDLSGSWKSTKTAAKDLKIYRIFPHQIDKLIFELNRKISKIS